MKPFFGIDLTKDKKNTHLNANEFITATVPADMIQRLEEAGDAVENVLKTAKLPLWMRIIKFIAEIVGLILFLSLFNTVMEVGFTALRESLLFVILDVVCISIWGVFAYLEKKKNKEVLEADQSQCALSAVQQNLQNSYDSLKVPRDAASLDILIFYYKMKGEKLIACPASSHTDSYLNIDMRVYIQKDFLCFADTENVYSIPLSALESIETVKKRIPMAGWNKEDAFNEGIYKPYKITTDNVGRFWVKSYHILTFNLNNEKYGIYFPSYELSQIEKITGLRAE